jgi:hypothetical protein
MAEAQYDAEAAVNLTFEIAQQIRPLLAGQAREVQGAVLAELLAMWIAGHHRCGDAVMAQVLEQHYRVVRDLVPINIYQGHQCEH